MRIAGKSQSKLLCSQVEATDNDCSPNYGDVCKYSISGSEAEAMFSVDQQGIITNTQPLWSRWTETCSVYSVLLPRYQNQLSTSNPWTRTWEIKVVDLIKLNLRILIDCCCCLSFTLSSMILMCCLMSGSPGRTCSRWWPLTAGARSPAPSWSPSPSPPGAPPPGQVSSVTIMQRDTWQ